MTKQEQILKLAEEAKDLIVEFYQLTAILDDYEDGESALNYIEIVDNGELILVEDDFTDVTMECSLSTVTSLFECDMEYSGQFSECIGLMQSYVEDKYGSMSKDEFIKYVGNLYYTEYRCKEIYARLKEMECEGKVLLGW